MKPESLPSEVFVTVLVLVMLIVYATEQEDEWIMMKKKSSKSLRSRDDFDLKTYSEAEKKIREYLKANADSKKIFSS